MEFGYNKLLGRQLTKKIFNLAISCRGFEPVQGEQQCDSLSRGALGTLRKRAIMLDCTQSALAFP